MFLLAWGLGSGVGEGSGLVGLLFELQGRSCLQQLGSILAVPHYLYSICYNPKPYSDSNYWILLKRSLAFVVSGPAVRFRCVSSKSGSSAPSTVPSFVP